MNILFKLLNVPDNTDIKNLTRQQVNLFYVKRKKQLRTYVGKADRFDNLILTFNGLCDYLGVTSEQQAFMISNGFDVEDVFGGEECPQSSEDIDVNLLFTKLLALVNFAKDELMGYVENGWSNYIPDTDTTLTSQKQTQPKTPEQKDKVCIGKEVFPKIIVPKDIDNEDSNLTFGKTQISERDIIKGKMDIVLGNDEEENITINLVPSILENDVLITRAIKLKNRDKVEKYAIYGGFKRPFFSGVEFVK